MSDDLLPKTAKPFERAIAGAGARMLTVDTDVIRRSRNPSRCSATFLPFLAWERSVHFWAPGDDVGNRARIQSAFTDHLNYGSPDALEAEIALDTAQTIEIREFWEERDLSWPYFVVNSIVAPGVVPDLDAVWRSAITRKNVRDMPIVRARVTQPPAQVAAGAAHRVMISTRTVTPVAREPHVGAAHRLLPKIQLRPLK